MKNTFYDALTSSKKNRLFVLTGVGLLMTIGVFFLSYSAFLRGRSRVSDPTFINTGLTTTVRLWPAPPPPGGYISPESHAALFAVESALLKRAEHAPPGLRCLHAASLFDPAPNVIVVRFDPAPGSGWTVVHNPRVRAREGAAVRPVKHVSVKDASAFHVWLMAAEVTLGGGAGRRELEETWTIANDEPLAHCLQTIKGILVDER